MLKVKGALNVSDIVDRENRKNREANLYKEQVEIGRVLYLSCVRGICITQACTIGMLKRHIAKIAKEKNVVPLLTFMISDASEFPFINKFTEKYIENSPAVWGETKKRFLLFFKRTYYYYKDHNYVCPLLIEDEDLPLYINHKWSSTIERDWYNERVKNIEAKANVL